MAVLPVLTWGDPRLKKNSEDVGDWTPELDQLVADMFATAHSSSARNGTCRDRPSVVSAYSTRGGTSG